MARTLSNTGQAREKRTRSKTFRLGYRVSRNGMRVQQHYNYGRFFISDVYTGYLSSGEFGFTIDEVEAWLDEAADEVQG